MNQKVERMFGLKQVLNQTTYKDLRSLWFLYCLVNHVQPEVVLELGTGKGCSTAFMAFGLHELKGKVVSIDDYRENFSLESVKKNLYDCKLVDRVELIVGNTFNTDKLFIERFGPDIKAEIVFMDASHHACDMHKEYQAIIPILLHRHVVIVDDLFENDEMNFVLDLVKLRFCELCLVLPYHNGMAVLFSDRTYFDEIDLIIKRCLIWTKSGVL